MRLTSQLSLVESIRVGSLCTVVLPLVCLAVKIVDPVHWFHLMISEIMDPVPADP